MSTKKIAVVGIDGSGKSTVIRRFCERKRMQGRVMSMTCPAYHETPNAPMASLSRDLDAFSHASDAVGSFEIKAAALFLQMTLFGPVERFLVETYRPTYLLCERHALIDSLAYGPFYTEMILKNPNRVEYEDRLRTLLPAGAFDAIQIWQLRRNPSLPLWNLPEYLKQLFSRPLKDQIWELSWEFGTSLPDQVLMLDVPAETALRRISNRPSAELHERLETLRFLQDRYHAVLEELDVDVRVIGSTDGEVDETVDEILQGAGIHDPS